MDFCDPGVAAGNADGFAPVSKAFDGLGYVLWKPSIGLCIGQGDKPWFGGSGAVVSESVKVAGGPDGPL